MVLGSHKTSLARGKLLANNSFWKLQVLSLEVAGPPIIVYKAWECKVGEQQIPEVSEAGLLCCREQFLLEQKSP